MGRSAKQVCRLTGRGAMYSPGAPSLGHEIERRFWQQIATGITIEKAAEAVADIHRTHRGAYGRPRIVRQLRAQGRAASEERVRLSLQRQGLRPVYRRAYWVTTDSTHSLPVASNLFIRTGEGWLYLAAILDLASRRIVGWLMSERIDAGLLCQPLRSACWQSKPAPELLLPSDRGAQYASRAYRKLAA